MNNEMVRLSDIEQCAYHEEKVVNGVLCYLFEGKWVEYSKEALTEKLAAEQDYYSEYVNNVYEKYVIPNGN